MKQMKQGYFFFYNQTDHFIITTAKRKTKTLCEKVITAFGYRLNENTVKWLQSAMQPATLEVKTCSHGEYYDIYGDGFGGYGHYVDGRDGETKIIEL